MGGFGKAIALGLGLRHDSGPQYRARQFQAEIKWLGIRSTRTYVGKPECNCVAERFIRTLKEECIHLHDFETIEEARAVIGAGTGTRPNTCGVTAATARGCVSGAR